MPRIDTPGVLETSERRLAALTADATRRWGTLTAHEMVCHLSDSFRGILGDRPVTPAAMSAVQRQLTRLIALHTPLPWPKGLPTRPEVDPRQLGTQPAAFEGDRAQLRELMRRFVGPGATYVEHPIFGALSHREWMVWAYRHVDHHFRQFGI